MTSDLDTLTEGRYLGKICPEHPALKGLRRKQSRECIGCRRDRAHERAKRPLERQRKIERRQELRDMQRYAVETERRVLREAELLAQQMASKECGDMLRWREYLSKALDQVKS